jgi:glycine/serine hydroxymethyltransferase
MGLMLSIDLERHMFLVSLITKGSQKVRYVIEMQIRNNTNAIVFDSRVLWNSAFVVEVSFSTRKRRESLIKRN